MDEKLTRREAFEHMLGIAALPMAASLPSEGVTVTSHDGDFATAPQLGGDLSTYRVVHPGETLDSVMYATEPVSFPGR